LPGVFSQKETETGPPEGDSRRRYEGMTAVRRKFFDDQAYRWNDLYYKDKDVLRRLDKFILEFGIKKGDKILDLGCGAGIISGRLSRLAGKGGKVFCCDFSLPMLKAAEKKKKAGLAFICADAQYLPFKRGFFDNVICFSCFPHFADKLKAMKDAAYVLKKGGHFTVGHLLCSREIAEVHRRVKGTVSHDRIPSRKWMTASLGRTGFKILKFLDKDGSYLLRAEKIKDYPARSGVL
jgi:ubiquinone/menaquinone biosynthesis C-methylase UbiE